MFLFELFFISTQRLYHQEISFSFCNDKIKVPNFFLAGNFVRCYFYRFQIQMINHFPNKTIKEFFSPRIEV